MDIKDIRNLADNREKAEKLLRERFHLDHFYDEQWTGIQHILRGERVLMIERTGFGKSLCYQFPATLFLQSYGGLFAINSPHAQPGGELVPFGDKCQLLKFATNPGGK